MCDKNEPHPTSNTFADLAKLAKGTKIVGDDGKPLVLYRGTSEGDDDRTGRRFWTDDEEIARGYAGCSDGDDPHVFKAFIKARKVFDLDVDRNARKLANALSRSFESGDPCWELVGYWNAADAIRAMGFDAVCMNDLNTTTKESHFIYVSLTDDQVILIEKTRLNERPSRSMRP